jgi:hypothetical protein
MSVESDEYVENKCEWVCMENPWCASYHLTYCNVQVLYAVQKTRDLTMRRGTEAGHRHQGGWLVNKESFCPSNGNKLQGWLAGKVKEEPEKATSM